MAGNHQIWSFDPVSIAAISASWDDQEGLVDGEIASAWFAQPSGLAAR